MRLATQLSGLDPEQVSGVVFKPGALSTTQRYKAMTDTETYDQVVKSWTDQFLRDAETLSAKEVYGRVEPLARQDEHGVSQLRLMLEQYPAALNAIEGALQQYKALPARVRMASDDLARAQTGLKLAKERAGIEGKGLESTHGYLHAAGLFMRAGVPLAAAWKAFELVQQGHPLWATGAVGAGLSIEAMKWWMQNTAAGKRAIRQGFPAPYAPTALRMGVQSGTQPPAPVTSEGGTTP
jgi:hypothetical protein